VALGPVDGTDQFPEIEGALARLPDAVLDGERFKNRRRGSRGVARAPALPSNSLSSRAAPSICA